MITGTIRTKFKLRDVRELVGTVWNEQLGDNNLFDIMSDRVLILKLIDDERFIRKVRHVPDMNLTLECLIFVLVRDALKKHDVTSVLVADYVSEMLIEFIKTDRVFRIDRYDDDKFFYIHELIESARHNSDTRKFKLYLQCGNYTLWTSGLFKEFLQMKGGDSFIDYYESWGKVGFRSAAMSPHAKYYGIKDHIELVAKYYHKIRKSLNHLQKTTFITRGVDNLN